MLKEISPEKPSMEGHSSSEPLTRANSSHSESLWKLKGVILLLVANTFTGFIFGWDTGTIGGITNMSSFKRHFAPLHADGEYKFSKMVAGLIVSIFNIGCAFGSFFVSKVGDAKGRKSGILLSVIIYIIGLVVQMTSVLSAKWYHLFVGRIITGVAVGTTSVLTPMFISETAPVSIRGGMVCVFQLMVTFGILFGNVTNYGCKNQYENNSSWLIPLGLGFIWAALILAGLSYIPESPYYLVMKGDREGAVKSVAWLNKLTKNDPLVTREVDSLFERSEKIRRETASAGKFEFITGSPKLGLRLFIGIVVMSIQQLSGANYFFYYGTSLFDSVGIDDSFKTSIILATVNCVPTFFSVYLVERFGRKSCLLFGSCLMSACMLIYASVGGFALYDSKGDSKYSSGCVMIVFTCIFIVGFATTWGPVCYVIVSELYPIRTKNKQMSIATASNWLWNFLISLFTPFITGAIGFKFGYVFAGCLIASIFFVLAFVPETKGLTPQDIDEIYEKGGITGLRRPKHREKAF